MSQREGARRERAGVRRSSQRERDLGLAGLAEVRRARATATGVPTGARSAGCGSSTERASERERAEGSEREMREREGEVERGV